MQLYRTDLFLVAVPRLYFFAAQGLQPFLAAHGFFAAQGLQPFLAAHGLQPFLAAHGFFAAQGLQPFLAPQAANAGEVIIVAPAIPPAMRPTPTMTGITVVDRSECLKDFI
jgi:hypothetical protein